jgi:hypothetical protein
MRILKVAGIGWLKWLKKPKIYKRIIPSEKYGSAYLYCADICESEGTVGFNKERIKIEGTLSVVYGLTGKYGLQHQIQIYSPHSSGKVRSEKRSTEESKWDRIEIYVPADFSEKFIEAIKGVKAKWGEEQRIGDPTLLQVGRKNKQH